MHLILVLENPFYFILQSMLRSSKWPLSLQFPTKNLHAPLISLKHATCPTHLILLDFITQIIFSEECRL